MVRGFSKNLFLIFGGKTLYFFALLSFANIVFLFPLWPLSISFLQAASGIITLFFLRMTVAILFGSSLKKAVFQSFLHWPSVLLLNYFSVLVLYNYMYKITDWKGRKIRQAGLS